MAIWIGTAVLLLVAFVCAGLALSHVLDYRRQRTWPMVTGRVALTGLDSERRFHDHAMRLVYLPTVAYRYEAGGQQHIGSRLATRDIVFSHEAEAKGFLGRFPAGAPVSVHYDPANPGQAVLDVRPPALVLPLAGAVLALAGALALALFGPT